ncbi:hypothetical protein [Streptomyces deserti]
MRRPGTPPHPYFAEATSGERERGSGAGGPTVQSLAYTLINDTIRPFTSAWHLRLTAHDAR